MRGAPDDDVEERGVELGLSLGANKNQNSTALARRGPACRILTAKDFPGSIAGPSRASRASPSPSQSSSVSSSSVRATDADSGSIKVKQGDDQGGARQIRVGVEREAGVGASVGNAAVLSSSMSLKEESRRRMVPAILPSRDADEFINLLHRSDPVRVEREHLFHDLCVGYDHPI
ncbi:hypothetical protein FCM35_KLT20307 [Carex littledalei]|uniref:Uncharacterized protein n=1 Tax=Carex littledalei TaxID=544730 RepID=A0A833QZF7_9POAL|nr:hypothetical protein FCM35_KLT20307 [Carex littledalei]